jgi:hypothetical protein
MTGINGKSHNKLSKIILIDSSTDIGEIDQYCDEYTKIISFDFQSHIQLKKQGFEHLQSDSFLSEKDFSDINKTIYRFLDWYNDPSISNNITYEGINFAKLYQEQYAVYFTSLLKNFFEIQNITKKYPNYSYLGTKILLQLVALFSNFTDNVQLQKNTSILFIHDKIRFNFKIGNKQSFIFIPRSFYLKLKNISEYFIHLFFSSSKKQRTEKNVLLVEFHTTRFKELFLNSINSKNNLIFYGRRRPSIWNFESFNIMKKSKCNIITSKDLLENNFDKNIKKGINNTLLNFEKLFQNDNFFYKFFLINGVSVGPILKNVFKILIEKRIPEIIYEIELIKQMFKKYNFSSIVILSETGLTEQIVIHFAKKIGLSVILLQIGMHNDTQEAYLPNSSLGVYPIDSTVFAVWGEVTKNDAITNGKIPVSKICVIGSPRYDNISINNSIKDEYVLLSTQGPRHNNPYGLTVEAFENYENAISIICKEVLKLKKKLIVKMHPGPDEYDVRKIINEIDPEIKVVTSGDIMPLIPGCSAMIVTGQSTTIVEALLLHKPVIVTGFTDYKYGISSVIQSKGCLTSSIEKFPDLLKQLFLDSKFKEQTISDGNKFVKSYISNFGKASKKLLLLLDSI